VQGLFAHRRKTVLNCLQLVSGLSKTALFDILAGLRIEPSDRPQKLSFQQFMSLYRAIGEADNE
jgi:16S rRNA A1518/A1519 N6-dimethyltransferase RsmA/KsgA/DIM1 with predicted DNA glycosylase/AP lyase activity